MDRMDRAIYLTRVSNLQEDVLHAERKDISPQENKARFIADRVAKAIFQTGRFVHAISNIIYNSSNDSILIVLFPVANRDIDRIIDLIKLVKGVGKVSDNVIEDDSTATSYHVLKLGVEGQASDLDTKPEGEEEEETGEPTPSEDEEKPVTSPVFGPGM